MSLCGLLLLDVAKKADEEFRTPHNSSHHTIRDAEEDVMKMSCYLIEEQVAFEKEGRGTAFQDPLIKGTEKIAGGYIEKYFNNEPDEASTDNSTVAQSLHNEDVSYELYHTNIHVYYYRYKIQ